VVFPVMSVPASRIELEIEHALGNTKLSVRS